MYQPILQFSERRTPHGIHLVGAIVLSKATSLSYKHENRSLAEGYIISELTDEWVRLRGLHKLELARKKLCDEGFSEQGEVRTVIAVLRH